MIYCLIVEAHGEVTIGRLGTLAFDGIYFYVGSAKGRAQGARLRRHLASAAGLPGRPFWHIDHLLPRGRLWGILTTASDAASECEVARRLREAGGEVVPHFGSSDCRCLGHLVRMTDRSTPAQVAQVVATLLPRASLYSFRRS